MKNIILMSGLFASFCVSQFVLADPLILSCLSDQTKDAMRLVVNEDWKQINGYVDYDHKVGAPKHDCSKSSEGALYGERLKPFTLECNTPESANAPVRCEGSLPDISSFANNSLESSFGTIKATGVFTKETNGVMTFTIEMKLEIDPMILAMFPAEMTDTLPGLDFSFICKTQN